MDGKVLTGRGDAAAGDRRETVANGVTTDEAALLPGECSDTSFRGDAEHWVTVYEEMVQHAQELAAAGDGLEPALTRSVCRYRERLEFWRRRLRELTPGGPA